MAGSVKIGSGEFRPDGRGPECIKIQQAYNCDTTGLEGRVRALDLLAKAIEEFARDKGIITRKRLTDFVIPGLRLTSFRVISGTHDVTYSGCFSGQISAEERRALQETRCPDDPTQRCPGCYHGLIERLSEDNAPHVNDGTPDSQRYYSALSALEVELAKTRDPYASAQNRHTIGEHASAIGQLFSQIDQLMNDFLANLKRIDSDDPKEAVEAIKALDGLIEKIQKLENPAVARLRGQVYALGNIVTTIGRTTPKPSQELLGSIGAAGSLLVASLVEGKQAKQDAQ